MTAASDSPLNHPPVRGAAGLLNDILDGLARDATAVPSNEPPPGASAKGPNANDAEAAAAKRSEGPDAKQSAGPEASLGDVLDRLDERAYGLLLLLLALPCCVPFIYLLPQIVALPMLAIAGQLAAGRRHPWLPPALRNRKFSIAALQGVVGRSEKYLSFIERFATPRLTIITSHAGARVVGLLLLVPTASILVPLPSTNTLPGIGVAVASIGLIERDGLLVILGLLLGLAWVALLLFLGLEAASLIKDWVSARAG
ncbi:MAG: exopolysaccharide biosynthesis protein [Pseudomonadota bacterium]